MEKDFVQSIKLEISKTFTLSAYERMSFHKILGIFKSDNGMNVLLGDLDRKGVIRRSAISVLSEFESRRVTESFLPILSDTKTPEIETNFILSHFEKFGTMEHVEALTGFAEKILNVREKLPLLTRTIFIIGKITGDSGTSSDFISKIAENAELPEEARCAAIETTSIKEVGYYENLLNENNDTINASVFKAIANLADMEMEKYREREGNDLFTVLPDENDRVLLDIRVLLGKHSIRFDSASNDAKTAFILAMISCGHREYIIYSMKALTSADTDLIDMTLFVIRANVDKIRTPDSFLRNLISLSSVTSRDSELIIEIFEKFFAGLGTSRSANMIRNKIYNFIIVMLDTYFEAFRKNFMIPEIMEKDYPENFRKIRSFILNNFTPDLKRKVLNYLGDENIPFKNLIEDITEKVSHIDESDQESLRALIEILWDRDPRARSVSSSRIQDIDFEKRYLKNRVLRLCEIVGRISIEEASSILVKIFNYIKKYNDREIFDSVTNALSRLNYPYMLSELEVLLVSGDENEKKNAVELFSLFSEQRSLNILLDYLKENHEANREITQSILQIILKRDIAMNKAVNQIAKAVAEKNPVPEIKRTAVQIIGKCGFETDILYLNELFVETDDNAVREGIVQALEYLLKTATDETKKSVFILLKKCLLDSAIRVRMYACMALLESNHPDALKALRDMMIIRNREVQREILQNLGGFMTIEIGYFLVSLMKEEYAISQDILPMLRYLPYEEKKDIDHFIVNIFKKHEGFSDYASSISKEIIKDEEQLKQIKTENVSVMMLNIFHYDDILSHYLSSDVSITARSIFSSALRAIKDNDGKVARLTGGRIAVYFENPLSATATALIIKQNILKLNRNLLPANQIRFSVFLSLYELDILSDEVVLIPEFESSAIFESNIDKRIFANRKISEISGRSFDCKVFPRFAVASKGIWLDLLEIENLLNFSISTDEIIVQLREEEKKKKEIEAQIEESLKAKTDNRNYNVAAYASKMDEIGRMLKHELVELNKYVSRRSTDRELNRNVEKIISNIHKRYMLEVSKTVME